jgi:hypothetical protein
MARRVINMKPIDFNKVTTYYQHYEEMDEYKDEGKDSLGYPEYVKYEDYKKLLDAYNNLLEGRN